MHVVRELDAGDMILSKAVLIDPQDTGGSMHDRLADLAVPVLTETIELLAGGKAPRTPQDAALSSYVPKLERADGRLDWTMPAEALERRIRAYDPWPGTFTMACDSSGEKRLKIFPPASVAGDFQLAAGEVRAEGGSLIVGCGEESLCLSFVQPEGGRRMSSEDFLRGRIPSCFR